MVERARKKSPENKQVQTEQRPQAPRRIHDRVLEILRRNNPQSSYNLLVDEVVEKRLAHDYQEYAPIRIAVYWLQVSLNTRTIPQAMRKTDQYLDRLEQKAPSVLEQLMQKDPRTSETPITQIRHAIISKEKFQRK